MVFNQNNPLLQQSVKRVYEEERLERVGFATQSILDAIPISEPSEDAFRSFRLQLRSMAAKPGLACSPRSTLKGFRLQTQSLPRKHQQSPNNRALSDVAGMSATWS